MEFPIFVAGGIDDQPHSVSAQTTSTSMTPSACFNVTDCTDQGGCSPNICSYSFVSFNPEVNPDQ